MNGCPLANHMANHMANWMQYSSYQLIRDPTRETLNSSTLIDHVATTNKSNVVVAGVHEISISDHYLIYCVRKFRGSAKKCIRTSQLGK